MSNDKSVLAEAGPWRIVRDSSMVALEGPRGRYVDSMEAMEQWTRQQFPHLEGHVLMFGLGLGISAKTVVEEAGHTSFLTVVEQSEEVIRLYPSSPYTVTSPKFKIVHGDFWTYMSPEKYDSILIDIFGESNLDGTSNMGDTNTARQLEGDGVGKIIERARTYTDGNVVLWPYGMVAKRGWK